MSVEAAIFDRLKVLVAERVYPEVAPEKTQRPYITYTQVGGRPTNFLDPTIPSKKNSRFQINVWATTRASVNAIAQQAEDILRIAPELQTTVLGEPVAVYEPDTKLRGSLQDFSFWF